MKNRNVITLGPQLTGTADKTVLSNAKHLHEHFEVIGQDTKLYQIHPDPSMHRGLKLWETTPPTLTPLHRYYQQREQHIIRRRARLYQRHQLTIRTYIHESTIV